MTSLTSLNCTYEMTDVLNFPKSCTYECIMGGNFPHRGAAALIIY